MESLIKVRKSGLPYRKESMALMEQMLKSDRNAVSYLAKRLNKKYGAVSNALSKLEEKQRVCRMDKGVWKLTDRGRSEADNFKGSVPPLETETKVSQLDTLVRVKDYLLESTSISERLENPQPIDWQREFIALAHELAKGR